MTAADGGGEQFEDGGFALLPRHTKVRVTGNNRTKSSLIGLTGVVKKSVGLGGWHWLRLSTGHECRLQRNALVVISRPTGFEVDSGSDDDVPEPRTAELAARLDGPRAKRTSRPPPSRHAEFIAPVTGKRSERARPSGTSGGPSVNFDKLGRDTLRKISRQHYNREPGPDDDECKRGLVNVIADHFAKEKVDETKVLLAFMKALAGGDTPSDQTEAQPPTTSRPA